MAVIGKTKSSKGVKDYLTLREVAERVKVKVPALKRWIKDGKIEGITWGYDRRNWIVIHKNSIPMIRKYRDKIEIVKHR